MLVYCEDICTCNAEPNFLWNHKSVRIRFNSNPFLILEDLKPIYITLKKNIHDARVSMFAKSQGLNSGLGMVDSDWPTVFDFLQSTPKMTGADSQALEMISKILNPNFLNSAAYG